MRSRRLIGLLVAALALFVTRRWLDVVEVRGRSMAPTILPRDRLLVARARARVGDVVLAKDPREPHRELIKRVARLGPYGVTLCGDNPAASTDARAFGAVTAETVAWRAVLRYWPPDRIGLIPDGPLPLVPVHEGGEPACAFPEALIVGT